MVKKVLLLVCLAISAGLSAITEVCDDDIYKGRANSPIKTLCIDGYTYYAVKDTIQIIQVFVEGKKGAAVPKPCKCVNRVMEYK